MTKIPAVIRFYRVSEPFGEFSNFFPLGFNLGGQYWKTSEHFFQAMKYVLTDLAYARRVMDASRPREAFQLSRDNSHVRRTDWEQVKDDVMRLAVLTKFLSDRRLAELLLSTGDALLIEATSDDYYWGEGTDGTGKNMLGIILMEVRELLAACGIDGTDDICQLNDELERLESLRQADFAALAA